MAAKGANEMCDGVIERSAAGGLVLRRQERRHVAERDGVVNQGDVVVEQAERETRITGNRFLLFKGRAASGARGPHAGAPAFRLCGR